LGQHPEATVQVEDGIKRFPAEPLAMTRQTP
jgi:hypothetical protein